MPHKRPPTTWQYPLIVLAGIVTVLGITGPFETDAALRLVPRIVYWFGVCALTYSVGFVSTEFLRPRLGHLPRAAMLILMGLVVGTGVTLCVLGTNYAVFGIWPSGVDLAIFLATVFSISITITLVLETVRLQIMPQSDGETRAPALLDRLPYDKRGALVALSVEDHYVHIQTTQGAEMVLMRLGDAMKEVGDVAGLQVHRSHWVALDQVTSATRQGNRAMLTMNTGTEVPVSRTYIGAIRDAGLLPTTGKPTD